MIALLLIFLRQWWTLIPHTHTLPTKKQQLNYAECAQLTVMKSWNAQLVWQKPWMNAQPRHPAFADILADGPLGLREGSALQPLCQSDFDYKLTHHETYTAGINAAWVTWSWTAMPKVPIVRTSVSRMIQVYGSQFDSDNWQWQSVKYSFTTEVAYLMAYQFQTPSPLELDLVADPVVSWVGKHNGNLRRLSPDEAHHAFILATYRDLERGRLTELKLNQVELYLIISVSWLAAASSDCHCHSIHVFLASLLYLLLSSWPIMAIVIVSQVLQNLNGVKCGSAARPRSSDVTTWSSAFGTQAASARTLGPLLTPCTTVLWPDRICDCQCQLGWHAKAHFQSGCTPGWAV